MNLAHCSAKVILLAVDFAAHSNLEGFATLAVRYDTILHTELVLRILLTYLPETVEPSAYGDFLSHLVDGDLKRHENATIDASHVDALSDIDAARAVKRLRLFSLANTDSPQGITEDPVICFLVQRAYRVDEEAGLLAQLPSLLTPFAQRNQALRIWVSSTVIPLIRRTSLYYQEPRTIHSLREFGRLSGSAAIRFLVDRIGDDERDLERVGRDLRGMVAPWLRDDSRWITKLDTGAASQTYHASSEICPGWQEVLEWLLLQATQSWKTAVNAIEQWDGPIDIDSEVPPMASEESRLRYLQGSYLQAALATIYLVPEASLSALADVHRVVRKLHVLSGEKDCGAIADLALKLPDLTLSGDFIVSTKTSAFMRKDFLEQHNTLTKPSSSTVGLTVSLVLSAHLSARLGVFWTIRRAGDLAFLQDQRDQKAEVSKLIRNLPSAGSAENDRFWARTRLEILWLRTWGNEANKSPGVGVFGSISPEYIEVELLKTFLHNSRYDLAREIYEERHDCPLPSNIVQEAVAHCALNAFDNAANPNRSRGGLKKCNDIIRCFPQTAGSELPVRRRIEALLKATHALSDYRLVLKQGEMFSPVVLRVHSDPISIIGKVLQQNPRAYTRYQEFLEVGVAMTEAGLPTSSKCQTDVATESVELIALEKRIVAMCIEAALGEDDFETAYSYVVSRLNPSVAADAEDDSTSDDYSWRAALGAGQYIRTERSQQPTHLGTASGNPEVRHLEQRIECLATALRIAPAKQLQEILKTFRRCEEQLDSAIQEEAAQEAAWDAAAAMTTIPGAFEETHRPQSMADPQRNMMALSAARHVEEAPMSLFDLSRATARAAQRNFTALSALQGGAPEMVEREEPQETVAQDAERVRRRDQLRDAATGTLVSGVGWLLGANVNRKDAGTG